MLRRSGIDIQTEGIVSHSSNKPPLSLTNIPDQDIFMRYPIDSEVLSRLEYVWGLGCYKNKGHIKAKWLTMPDAAEELLWRR